MNLTPKDRLRRALLHQPIDRLPWQINYTARMGAKMAAHFNIPPADLPRILGNHLVRVDILHPERTSPDGAVRFDWWGAGHATGEEGYFIRVHPLAGSKDLDAYLWPDPHSPGLFDAARAAIASQIASGGEVFIAPNLGFALFERAWSLRGFEQLFVDMAEDPGFVEELFERITAIQLVLVRRFLELGVDGGYFGDDYGAQTNCSFRRPGGAG